MPQKILLATFGTLGDVYPFVAIAKALSSRGMEPLIAAPLMHRATIEGEGLADALARAAKAAALVPVIAQDRGVEAVADWVGSVVLRPTAV